MATGESRTFIRSEEELSTTERRIRAVGRLRVRRRIVEEVVHVPVTVRREELELVEEELAMDGDAAGDEPPISEQVLELVLHEEEPVVSTRVVARERVTITRAVVQDAQAVSASLRKEVVELEDLPPRS